MSQPLSKLEFEFKEKYRHGWISKLKDKLEIISSDNSNVKNKNDTNNNASVIILTLVIVSTIILIIIIIATIIIVTIIIIMKDPF